jgi:hypothetical protein
MCIMEAVTSHDIAIALRELVAVVPILCVAALAAVQSSARE